MTRSAFGTITRLDAERIRVRWEEPSQDGRRVQRSRTVRGTMDDAVRILAAERLSRGDLPMSEPLPLSLFWASEYWPHVSRRLRPSTLRGYDADWRLVVEPMFGDMDMRTASSRIIEREILSIPAPGTQRNAYKLLRQMFNKAMDWELIERNPMGRRFDLARIERTEPDRYRADEVPAVLDAWRGQYWESAAICSMCGGLRREEACALRWDDISFAGGAAIVHVRRAITDMVGGASVGRTKTAKSTRTVAIAGHPASRLSSIAGTGALCPGNVDGFALPQQVAKDYRDHMRASGLRYVPWMNLRHTYATILRSAGVDAADVALALGHSDISTAYRHYVSATMDTVLGVAEAYAASCRIGGETG